MRTVTQKNEGIQHIKAKLGESLKKKLESGVMHGQYNRSTDRQLVGGEDIPLAVEGRAESKIIVTQDRALQTKCHATKISQTETDSKCRLCK